MTPATAPDAPTSGTVESTWASTWAAVATTPEMR